MDPVAACVNAGADGRVDEPGRHLVPFGVSPCGIDAAVASEATLLLRSAPPPGSSVTAAHTDLLLKSADEPAWTVARHVVGRLATAVNTTSAHYKGARAENGIGVFGATYTSHQVSVICGQDADSRALAVRVIVSDAWPVRLSMPFFPIAMLATSFAISVPLGGFDGVLVGLVAGVVAGFLASFLVFNLVRWIRSRSQATTKQARNVVAVFAEQVEAVGTQLNLEVVRRDARIFGMDADPPRATGSEMGVTALEMGDAGAWTKLFSDALAGVPH